MAARWLRVIWPAVLLLVFVTNLRDLPDRVHPAAPAVDCDRLPPGDLEALERCAAMRPSDVELLTDAGAVYEHAERWDRAEDAYRRAAIDPQDGDVRVRLGRSCSDAATSTVPPEAAAALAVQPGRAAALELMRRSGGAIVIRRPLLVALARALHLVFFLATSVYCLLTSVRSPTSSSSSRWSAWP
jgi:hypothetical protein